MGETSKRQGGWSFMSNKDRLKANIRRLIRANRNNLSAADKSQAELGLAKQITNNQILVRYQHIACFLSFDGEISTKSIIRQIFNQQKACYLPKLRPYKPNRLWFMPYTEDSILSTNRYGIPEVDLLANHALPVSKLELVLLPLVAFDKKGHRLGMGGGFYDATFAHLKEKKNRPLFIGLAYESQRVDSLPGDPWDLPLDGVCTEKTFYHF